MYGPLMIAKLYEMPADRIQGAGLSSRVFDGMVKPQRLPCLDHRFQNAILRLQDIGAAQTRERTQSLVAEESGHLDGLIQMLTRAGDIAEQKPQPAKMMASRRLPGEITQPGGDRQRGFLCHRKPLPVLVALEIPPGDPGQLPGVRSMTAFGGLADHGEQDMLLIVKPLSGLRRPSDFLEHDTWLWPGAGDLRLVGAKESRCRAGGVQIVAEDAVHRGMPVGFALAGHRFLNRVRAQQIMAYVATWNVFGKQMLVAQLRQRLVRLLSRQPREAGRRRTGDIRSWVNAKQAEHPRCAIPEFCPRPGKNHPDAGGRLPRLQYVQPPARVPHL